MSDLSPASPPDIGADYFDGRSARAHPVRVRVDGDSLVIAGDGFERRELLASLRWPERTRHGVRLLHLADGASVPITRFSVADAGDVVLSATQVEFDWRGRRVHLPMGGRFNVANALAAATVAERLGVPVDTIVSALATVAPVPGRFEPVDAGQDFAVVVDYAHTPDGLAQVLAAAREGAGTGRVLVVFGCGGDRDAAKRPEMGRIAAEQADVVVVTSDNPRHEDPAAIISAVLSGIPAGPRARVTSDPDRRAAIALALADSRPGDVVVIAGKGHEPYQEIGDVQLPFDDRAVVRELLGGQP